MGEFKEGSLFLGRGARLDVVVVVAARMPGQIRHELAPTVDLPNVVYAPLAAGEFQASRNLKKRDTHSGPKNLDCVVERAQLDIVG